MFRVYRCSVQPHPAVEAVEFLGVESAAVADPTTRAHSEFRGIQPIQPARCIVALCIHALCYPRRKLASTEKPAISMS